LNAQIEARTRTDTSARWVERLNAAEVPCGPIYRMDQVFDDALVKHLGMAQAVEHPELGRIEIVGQAIKLSRTPARLETASPQAGEHTDAILCELGYDDAAIASMRAEGVI